MLIQQIGESAKRLKYLQTQSSYDGSRQLKLPNGSYAIANTAIFGAMNFLHEMESELNCSFGINQQTPNLQRRSTQAKDRTSTDVGGVIGGLVCGIFGMVFTVLAVISLVNATTAKIDFTTGIIFGVILFGLSLASFFFSYMLFTNKS